MIWVHDQLPTPLWDWVDSTRNILSTKSCCCWRAISSTSASKPNRKRRTIFRGNSSLFPVSPGWPEHVGCLNKCLHIIYVHNLFCHLGKTSGTHDLFTGAWGGSAALSPTRDSNSRMETFTLWWSLDLVTVRDSLTWMDSLSVMKYANTAKRSRVSNVSEATMTLVSVLFNIL